MPAIDVIERVCAEALTLGTREVDEALTVTLSESQQSKIDVLLAMREGAAASTLAWLQSTEQRLRVQIGLNKGEAKNAPARAVSSNRPGELRDRSENQRYRASDLNLVVAAIVLWNTVYLRRALQSLKAHGQPVDDVLCNICRRWAGNTSFWPAIMPGARANRSSGANSGPYVPSPILNVRFFPFREQTLSVCCNDASIF